MIELPTTCKYICILPNKTFFYKTKKCSLDYNTLSFILSGIHILLMYSILAFSNFLSAFFNFPRAFSNFLPAFLLLSPPTNNSSLLRRKSTFLICFLLPKPVCVFFSFFEWLFFFSFSSAFPHLMFLSNELKSRLGVTTAKRKH